MLELNKNHKKADLRYIKKPLRTVALTLSIPVVMFIYSGASIDTTYALENDGVTNERIVPDTAYEDIMLEVDPNQEQVTKKMLEKAKSLDFKIEGGDSLEFLKYCKNLEELRIMFLEGDTSSLKTFPEIKDLKDVTLITTDTIGLINDDTFFKNCKDLEKLTLYGTSLGPNTIENSKNLKTLKVVRTRNLDVDLNNTSIEKLDISENGPYDIPVFLDSKDYKKLDDIKVVFKDDETKEKYLEVSKKLDDIVKNLNLDDLSEKEKIDKILVYVLKNLTYSEDVENNFETKGGTLYEPLKNGKGVCQNYADFTKALVKKANVDAYSISSETHAFNIIEVEGTNYVYDPTWLDSNDKKKVIKDIKKGEGKNHNWYMEKASLKHMEELDIEKDHNYVGYPDYLGKDMAKEEAKVYIQNEVINTTYGALIGVLSSLGMAIPLKKLKIDKKDKKRK